MFKRGTRKRLHFQMARTGAVKQVSEDRVPTRDEGAPVAPAEQIDKADPWE